MNTAKETIPDIKPRCLFLQRIAGRPAVVYQSLPSLVLLQAADNDDEALLRHRPPDGDDPRHRRRGPASGGAAAACHQHLQQHALPRQHHHHHHHHQLKEALARKLSASMDRFDVATGIGAGSASDVAATRESAAVGGDTASDDIGVRIVAFNGLTEDSRTVIEKTTTTPTDTEVPNCFCNRSDNENQDAKGV
jgi:hypothetical protein